MKTQQKGFGLIGVIVAIAVITVISAVGFLTYTQHKKTNGGQSGISGKHYDLDKERGNVERTVNEQLKPLKSQLGLLGFKDLDDLKTECEYYTIEAPDPNSMADVWAAPGDHFRCTSGVDRLITIPSDKAGFILMISELDKTLQANGWSLVSDKPTTEWAETITRATPQADQSYSKQANGLDCGISFWSAFSDPDPPATSFDMDCGIDD